MTSRRAGGVAALAAACALVAGSRAASAATRNPLDYLDGDAPVVARLDLQTWEQAVQLYRTSGLPGATKAVFVASAAASALVGFDPLVRAGWYRAGIDADVPVFVSFGALDKPGASGTRFWRARIVLAVDDAGKVDATLTRLTKVLPVLAPVTPARAKDVAAAVGAPSKDATGVVRALRKAGIQVVGQLPLIGTLVAFHRAGGSLLVELLTPANATPLSWPRDRARLLALFGRVPRAVGARLTGGAAARLRGPGTVVWADAVGLYDLQRNLEQELDLRLAAAVASTQPHKEPDVCAGFRDLATSGPFTDIAAALDIRPRAAGKGASIHTDFVYGLRGAFKLASALLVDDDHLVDAKALISGGAVLSGEIFLKSLAPIRALPRPSVLKLQRQELRWTLLNCSASAWTSLVLFGWPQALGMVLDEIAKIHPQAAALVTGTRNTAFGFRKVSRDVSGLLGFVEMAVSANVAAYPAHYFATVWGAKQHDTSRRVAVDTWGNGPLRPYHLPIAGHDVFGVAFNPRAIGWRVSQLTPTSRSMDRLVAEVYVNPAGLIDQLAATSSWAAALQPISTRLRTASLHTQFAADTLESAVVLDVR